MFVIEYKVKASKTQYSAIDEAIRTVQFVRNKCVRHWMDNNGVGKYDLSKLCKQLADEFDFAKKLNSQARQAGSERAWSAINRFYKNCKAGIKGKKGYPKFQKNNRSVEYKTTGWKLDPNTKKHITFTDKNNIGRLKLVGSRDIYFYSPDQIKRVRLVRRADGYYCQFCINVDVKEEHEPTEQIIGLDVGLRDFFTDSKGHKEPNPRFFRKGEQELKRHQRLVSRKQKGSNNRGKARQKLAKKHLKISRQRREHARRTARCVVQSNDLVAYEDLQVRNLVKNHNLAKSISDVGWYQFRVWLEYFAKKFGKITVAVPPQYTSQECSNCGRIVKKSLSTRTHTCKCGCQLDRDENAAINILKKGLSTVGHTGTWGLDSLNASGDETATQVGQVLFEQVTSQNEESQGKARSVAVGVSTQD
ncbi:transposase, IS605 OrfB family [Halothece sp. PCC 7418]|uniref:RNA-guided endonuclease InsQ/TnpB family protein n=1 Tax=Halothece sp. (strain PCC 7418) TaxID=65093 RepID=UPI0002A06DD3|nr:RNA-guided endonuclease TnpB family protein [Halothece sp. PCC 7418]AFZ42339.1 transposase, IS605 OrfB family [Halothece sp. PCC 7418]